MAKDVLEEIGLSDERHDQIMEALKVAAGRDHGVATMVELFQYIAAVAETLPMTALETAAITYIIFNRARRL